jgi:hypothetical protein
MFKKTTKKQRDLINRHLANPLTFTSREVMKRLGQKYDHNSFCRLVYRVMREQALT